MPIYEYHCTKCGDFERTQRITDEPLQRCPTCRRKVRRLISNTSFHLKGSGWYVTDYARAGKDKPAEGASKKEPSEAAPKSAPKDAKSSKPAKSTSSSAATSSAES